ncbi:efflux RND transporter permease subunit [Rathayibacter iranicus]|uniref:AcrB/AcrD/AcrF family protein n=2 Tax=Rathayibacter iranicus TaxID=59737 RepID=A0AAD1EN64_9MICO|nr:efflux RND transporter permease subunit [Rathayibacter iranicus]AZZ56204.1 AcrB/AcrD/AcrF family protein [Rathayibacter iranicus]MWV30094.1 MMPL family transporter [Rathayibacter iranicus NCPPB 2253 = VKM Ac-1602]PPI46271.1 hydrogenase expression protein [Rathayibacter iranicus]PPI59646.1 hydrogenase expression protein [Rathayibacter iranicus]PPI71123.1 hydrogenase expression protein [Rathayibacter iranicus]
MHLLAVLSMKNRALIALVTVVIAVFGGVALTGLKQELAPSISFPQLAVITSYPGAAPEVVNDDVSTPIETAIQGVPGLETTSATSSTNSSQISASFTYGTDLATAEQKILQAINRIRTTLPDGVDPQVVTGSFDDLPVLQLAVSSDGDADALADRLRTSVIPDLEKVDGVREVALVGESAQRVTITPDDAALAAAGVSVSDIRTALQQNGVLVAGGQITQDGSTFSVQSGVKLDSTDAIAALPLLPSGGGSASAGAAPAAAPTVTTLGSVASVAVTDAPVTSISRVNGQPALTLSITKLPAANTVDVSTSVTALLPDLEASIGDNATFTSVFDQAPYIQESIASLAQEGALGLVFAVLVILLFLLSVRSTLVTAISIPTSVLITFIGLQTAGYTLNILTLGALTIAIGRVVDDSIVVIENIKRHLDAGEERVATIATAVREVAGAITASTITTVAVFLPISFVGGTTGELFRPFALTVSIALLASLVVALTIVPVLAYWFLRPSKRPAVRQAAQAALAEERSAAGESLAPVQEAPHHGAHSGPRRARGLQVVYGPIIHWTLKHSVVTVLLALLVLVGTGALSPLMKTNFLGSSGQNTFTVTQTVPVGQSLDAQDATAQQASSAILGVGGVETVQLTIGSAGGLQSAFGGGGGGATSIRYSVTTDESADQEAVQAGVREALASVASADDISVAASSGFGASSNIEVDLTTASQSDLQSGNDQLLAALRGTEGISQAESNLSSSLPYIAVRVDRDAAARAGLSEVALGTLVSQALQPTAVGSVVIDDRTLSIYLADAQPPATVDELRGLEVPTLAGTVTLSSLAAVEQTDGPASITTERGQRTATITVTPQGDDLASANAAVQEAITATSLPAGVDASLGGVTADQADAFSQLGIALLVAILIVYVVMVATFRSLLQPLLLLVSVPFAATGAILLQVVTGVPLGVPSLIGVLMLIGIVVTNAIVLVDLVNQYRDRGMPVREALLHGTERRLRPILMTALATIFALLPMALGITGHGGFISQPLAIVVIGGLVSSTVLTLVVLPVVYNLVEGYRERRRAVRAGKASA